MAEFIDKDKLIKIPPVGSFDKREIRLRKDQSLSSLWLGIDPSTNVGVEARPGWMEGSHSVWSPSLIKGPGPHLKSPIKPTISDWVWGAQSENLVYGFPTGPVLSSRPGNYDPFNIYHRFAYGPWEKKTLSYKKGELRKSKDFLEAIASQQTGIHSSLSGGSPFSGGKSSKPNIFKSRVSTDALKFEHVLVKSPTTGKMLNVSWARSSVVGETLSGKREKFGRSQAEAQIIRRNLERTMFGRGHSKEYIERINRMSANMPEMHKGVLLRSVAEKSGLNWEDLTSRVEKSSWTMTHQSGKSVTGPIAKTIMGGKGLHFYDASVFQNDKIMKETFGIHLGRLLPLFRQSTIGGESSIERERILKSLNEARLAEAEVPKLTPFEAAFHRETYSSIDKMVSSGEITTREADNLRKLATRADPHSKELIKAVSDMQYFSMPELQAWRRRDASVFAKRLWSKFGLEDFNPELLTNMGVVRRTRSGEITPRRSYRLDKRGDIVQGLARFDSETGKWMKSTVQQFQADLGDKLISGYASTHLGRDMAGKSSFINRMPIDQFSSKYMSDESFRRGIIPISVSSRTGHYLDDEGARIMMADYFGRKRAFEITASTSKRKVGRLYRFQKSDPIVKIIDESAEYLDDSVRAFMDARFRGKNKAHVSYVKAREVLGSLMKKKEQLSGMLPGLEETLAPHIRELEKALTTSYGPKNNIDRYGNLKMGKNFRITERMSSGEFRHRIKKSWVREDISSRIKGTLENLVASFVQRPGGGFEVALPRSMSQIEAARFLENMPTAGFKAMTASGDVLTGRAATRASEIYQGGKNLKRVLSGGFREVQKSILDVPVYLVREAGPGRRWVPSKVAGEQGRYVTQKHSKWATKVYLPTGNLVGELPIDIAENIVGLKNKPFSLLHGIINPEHAAALDPKSPYTEKLFIGGFKRMEKGSQGMLAHELHLYRDVHGVKVPVSGMKILASGYGQIVSQTLQSGEGLKELKVREAELASLMLRFEDKFKPEWAGGKTGEELILEKGKPKTTSKAISVATRSAEEAAGKRVKTITEKFLNKRMIGAATFAAGLLIGWSAFRSKPEPLMKEEDVSHSLYGGGSAGGGNYGPSHSAPARVVQMNTGYNVDVNVSAIDAHNNIDNRALAQSMSALSSRALGHNNIRTSMNITDDSVVSNRHSSKRAVNNMLMA